jgi:hypothetical protein
LYAPGSANPFSEKTYSIPPEQVVGSSVGAEFQIKDGKPVDIYGFAFLFPTMRGDAQRGSTPASRRPTASP